MPADPMEKSSASPVAATPASLPQHAPPDKPRTAADHRKSSKPIMEKRRRARINESLGQLKSLILDALKKDTSRHSKLEKADILEMTVKHLRSLQRAQMTAALHTEPSVLGKYRAGFNECLAEVTRFLSSCEGVDADVRARLLAHLAACLSQIAAVNYPSPPPPPPKAAPPGPAFGQMPAANGGPCKLGTAAAAAEGAKVYGGFQLVPAADGQFAFLIPASASLVPHGGAVIPLYAGGGLGAGLGAGLPPPAAGAPSLPADSVWRPW